jgi:hypothetical protein
MPPNKRLKLTGHRALQISVLPFGHEITRFQLPGHRGRQLSREPLGSTGLCPMTSWREMAAFTGVDLEDSFIKGWQLSADSFVIELEASLWPEHPSYESPIKGNYTCYKPARLVFPSARQVSGLRPMSDVRATRDPNGSIDYGTIDVLTGSGARYRVVGEFGSVTLESDAPVLQLTSETQCGAA